jgi:hypothetical protein
LECQHVVSLGLKEGRPLFEKDILFGGIEDGFLGARKEDVDLGWAWEMRLVKAIEPWQMHLLSLTKRFGRAAMTAITIFFLNLSDTGERAMREPALRRLETSQSILTPARKVEKHILTPRPRLDNVMP